MPPDFQLFQHVLDDGIDFGFNSWRKIQPDFKELRLYAPEHQPLWKYILELCRSQHIGNADLVRGHFHGKEGRHVVPFEANKGTRFFPGLYGVNQNQVIGLLKIVEEIHTQSTPIQNLDLLRKLIVLNQPFDYMHPNTLIRHQQIADAQYKCRNRATV